MSSNPYGAYLESKVLAASPLQLVHLAYEGAIAAVAKARVHLAENKIFDRAQAITKAQLIIQELQSSLNVEKGGGLGVQLARLYAYIQQRLNEANFKQIDEPLAEVQRLLETLDEAWRELAITDVASHSSPWMTSDSPVYSGAEFTF
jgi:flagellar protein FliS